MEKQNCWEFKNCGREPGGSKAKELGVCSAATEDRLNGINSGHNSGRACWAVAGTLCGGKAQGTYAQKLFACLECEFYKTTVYEEGLKHVSLGEMLQKLREPA